MFPPTELLTSSLIETPYLNQFGCKLKNIRNGEIGIVMFPAALFKEIISCTALCFLYENDVSWPS